MGVLIPGYGRIPEWISQKKKESQIKIEFPMDWYQKNDFLGFAVYSVFSPLHVNCMKNPCRLKCELNFHGHQSKVLDDIPSPMDEFSSMHDYLCCRFVGGESNRVWVAYYPKVAIDNKYWSNEWRHLKASFHGEGVKVEECGFHLIYSEEHQQNQDEEDNHMPMFSNLSENSGDDRSTVENVKRRRDDAEHNQAEEPLHKRSRESNIEALNSFTNHQVHHQNFFSSCKPFLYRVI